MFVSDVSISHRDGAKPGAVTHPAPVCSQLRPQLVVAHSNSSSSFLYVLTRSFPPSFPSQSCSALQLTDMCAKKLIISKLIIPTQHIHNHSKAFYIPEKGHYEQSPLQVWKKQEKDK